MSEKPHFLKELKRRKVVRVAVVYVASSFAVLQGADLVFPRLGLPDWTLTFMIVLGMAGLPVALVLAWAFEVRPDSDRSEPTGDESAPARTAPPRWFSAGAMITAVLMLLGGLGLGWLARGGTSGSTDLSGGSQSTEAEQHRPSIAVLPFADMSPAGDMVYFGDGVAEEILNVLAQISELKVAGRTSSFSFRDRAEDVAAIGVSLDVATVLEGSIRVSGDRLRVTAQLIQVSDHSHLWSQNYDRSLSEDIFSVQDDIAASVASALQVELGTADEMPPTQNVEAYQSYLQGKHLFYQRTNESLTRSIELFQRAIDLDPTFAEGLAGLALVYNTLPGYAAGTDDFNRDLYERAEEASDAALALDPTLGDAYAVRGNLLSDRGDYVSGYNAFRRGVAAEPSNTTLRLWLGIVELQTGRIEAGAELIEGAFTNDPASGVLAGWMGHLEYLRGNVDGAFEYYSRSIDLGWGAGDAWFCRVATSEGRDEEALSSCRRYYPDSLDGVEEGRDSDFGRFIAGLEDGDPELLGAYLDRLTTKTSATSLLDVAMWAPAASVLRESPQFPEWVERMGFPEYWDVVGWPEFCARDDDGALVCH
jgi:TolB-like protein